MKRVVVIQEKIDVIYTPDILVVRVSINGCTLVGDNSTVRTYVVLGTTRGEDIHTEDKERTTDK